MMNSISASQHAQPFGLRLSALQPGLANPKAEMLTSLRSRRADMLTSL
jgi:hypothetical protein